MSEAFLIWGAGGHGRVVRDVIVAAGHRVIGFVDRAPDQRGADLPVIDEERLLAAIGQALPLGASAIALGIGDNFARARLVSGLPGSLLPPLVHARAVVGSRVEVGAGTVIMAGAVVQTGTRLGPAVIVNTGAIVDHDCLLETAVHVSPGAVVCGGVTIRELAWIGAGAVVIPGLTVGAGAIVGAGATVIRDVPDGATVVGSPAREVARPG